jgi:mannose-6-phosphate isomerase-like protein (cupin superfamily)
VKPWGYEIIWANEPQYAAKILHIEPGEMLSRQYHQVKTESIRVVAGTLRLELGDEGDGDWESAVMTAGQSICIQPYTIHRFIAFDSDPVDLFEVSVGPLDDVVRLEDKYLRVTPH